MSNNILTPADAFALADVMLALTAHRRIKWTTDNGATIQEGEMRSLVNGANDFGSLAWGKDVREGFIWVTCGTYETTVGVAEAITLLGEGAMGFTDKAGDFVAH